MADRLNDSFVNAANALTQLLRDSQTATEEAYNRGRTDACTDIVNWLLQAQHGDLKYVPVSSLLQHLQKQLPGLKINSFPDSRKRLREGRHEN